MKFNLVLKKDQLGGIYVDPPTVRQYRTIDSALRAMRRGGGRYSVSVELSGVTYYLDDPQYKLFVGPTGWIQF